MILKITNQVYEFTPSLFKVEIDSVYFDLQIGASHFIHWSNYEKYGTVYFFVVYPPEAESMGR